MPSTCSNEKIKMTRTWPSWLKILRFVYGWVIHLFSHLSYTRKAPPFNKPRSWYTRGRTNQQTFISLFLALFLPLRLYEQRESPISYTFTLLRSTSCTVLSSPLSILVPFAFFFFANPWSYTTFASITWWILPNLHWINPLNTIGNVKPTNVRIFNFHWLFHVFFFFFSFLLRDQVSVVQIIISYARHAYRSGRIQLNDHRLKYDTKKISFQYLNALRLAESTNDHFTFYIVTRNFFINTWVLEWKLIGVACTNKIAALFRLYCIKTHITIFKFKKIIHIRI